MSEWRPIAEAPKDGTLVDLWVQIGLDPEFGPDSECRIIDCQYKNGAWYSWEGKDDNKPWRIPGHKITHWAHRPQPPQNERTE